MTETTEPAKPVDPLAAVRASVAAGKHSTVKANEKPLTADERLDNLETALASLGAATIVGHSSPRPEKHFLSFFQRHKSKL